MAPSRIRREGFTGQHLVVVPAPVRKTAARHPLLKGLFVTDAGYFPAAEGHRVERPQGAATHLLIVCRQGSGWVKSQGRTFDVQAGDVLWLPCDTPHAYGAGERPWHILWAHFSGAEAPAWRAELGWAERAPVGQVHLGAERVGTLGLDKVYAILESGYSIRHLLRASAALRQAFCTALELMNRAGAARTAEERTAAVRDEIFANPTRPLRLEELAMSAGLSVPHFCALFRRQTGYAPIDFVIRQRIRQACRLLDTTAAPVRAVASESGFGDPYYFSRCFRRIMGDSPRAYRRRIKG